MEGTQPLEQWVHEHRVTWELGPLQEIVDGRPTTVGFELRLFGQHEAGVHASPGCPDCVALHERLRAIANATFPREERPSRYEIEPFFGSLHMRPEGEWKPEVQLTVRIVHRKDYLKPIDPCAQRCAEEIQQGLRRLGVQPRRWSAARGAGQERR